MMWSTTERPRCKLLRHGWLGGGLTHITPESLTARPLHDSVHFRFKSTLELEDNVTLGYLTGVILTLLAWL